jgi:DNA-binding transcriptional LysR family regulator
MSLAQIEYFVAVAQEGHVGRAASSLRIAQPAVSRQIRRLEEELGSPLFLRTSRGMTLSDAGEVFLAHARAILDGVRAARDEVKGITSAGAEATPSAPTGTRTRAASSEPTASARGQASSRRAPLRR